MLHSGNSIKDKVSNLSDFPVLMAATHSDPNPTPSHLSQRVVSISFVSRQKCVHLMEHLLDIAQSSHKSIHSRIKAVRLLQELVLKGDPEFQALLQKEEHKLKAVSGFLDPQAPLESSRLREATAALLEVLFEETNRPLPPSGPFTPPISSQVPMSPSYNRGQYQGFGNPNFVQGRASSSSGIISLVSEKVSDLLSHVPSPDPNRFSSRGYSDRSLNPAIDSGYAQNTFYSGARHSYPTGSRDAQLPDSLPHTPGIAGAEWDSSVPTVSPSLRSEAVNGSGSRGEEGQLERQLVLSFTTESGVRNRPNRQELDELIVRCRSLDCAAIAELLAAQIGPQGTGSKLKSLFGLEALYRAFPALVGDVITTQSEQIGCLSEKGESQAIRSKAREILSLMGLPSSAQEYSKPTESLLQKECSTTATDSLIGTEYSNTATESLIGTEYSNTASENLIGTECSNTASENLIGKECSNTASENLIGTEYSTTAPENLIGTEYSNTASENLIGTDGELLQEISEQNSLFEGMLTSQPNSTLIAGLEEFALPELAPNRTELTDMINLGSSKVPCQFDPLLDTGSKNVANQTPVLNSLVMPTYTPQSNQSYLSLTPARSPQAKQNAKSDSFGFISEHILSLKESK